MIRIMIRIVIRSMLIGVVEARLPVRMRSGRGRVRVRDSVRDNSLYVPFFL